MRSYEYMDPAKVLMARERMTCEGCDSLDAYSDGEDEKVFCRNDKASIRDVVRAPNVRCKHFNGVSDGLPLAAR